MSAAAAASIVAVVVPGRVILVVQIIQQLIALLSLIQEALGIGLRVKAFVKFMVKQMVVLGFGQVIFVAHFKLH